MLSPPLKLLWPRRRRRRKSTRFDRNAAPPPTPFDVSVLSVHPLDDHVAVWTFDAEVTLEPGAVVLELLIDMNTGTKAPAETWQVSATQIAGNYDDGAINLGDGWHIDEMPEGLVLAPGGVIVVPQAGSLE